MTIDRKKMAREWYPFEPISKKGLEYGGTRLAGKNDKVMGQKWDEIHYGTKMANVQELAILVSQWMKNLDDDANGLGVEVLRDLIDHLVTNELMTIWQIQVICFDAYNEWAGK